MPEQIAFEIFLADVITCFTCLTAERINEEIYKALQRAVSIFKLQYVLLLEYVSEANSIDLLQSVSASDSLPLPSDLVFSNAFPWCSQLLKQGQTVSLYSLNDLPSDAARDGMNCRDYHIGSVLAFPLIVRGALRYFIVLTAVHPVAWSRQQILRFRALGGVIASALEREKMIHSLQVSEQKWRLIVENIPAFLCYIDRKRRYQFLSSEYARLFKKPVDQMLGKHVWEVIGQRAYAAAKDKIDLVLDGQRVDFQSTLEEVANGPRHYAGVLVPDVSPAGEVLGGYALLQDITEIKNLEYESRLLRERLAHMDRVATVHAMTSTLAHEVNQPLSAILSNAQAAIRYIDRGAFDLEEIRQILQEIESDDKRASDVINRVRNLIKKRKSPEHECLDLREIILEVLKMSHGELMVRKAKVTTAVAEDLPYVLGDRVQIQQVLINLLFNALDAVQAYPPAERCISVSAWRQADGVCLSVTDSGPGMDQTMLESIFEPFYTNKMHGIGLGLAVCHSLIKDHGGRIWAELPEEKGVRVVVCLPAVT